MIEERIARSGESYLRMNGRNLSSQVDPYKEAQLWVNKYSSRLKRCSFPIVLIGLGSGHQLYVLMEQFPDRHIYVIESNKEVLKFFLRTREIKNPNVEFFLIQELNLENEVKKIIKNTFHLLCHPTTQIYDNVEYKKIYQIFLARNESDFCQQAKWRQWDIKNEKGDSKDFCNSDNKNHPLTIKTLFKWVSQNQKPFHRSAKLILALRELVR